LGLKPLWDTAKLTQKSDWPDILKSLSLTEKQIQVLTAILTFFREKGTVIDFQPLMKHGSSSRYWQNHFISTYALRNFFEQNLAHNGTCSYRYAWDAMHCLITCGFIEPNVTVPLKGKRVRGYCFSDRALRHFNNMAHILPKLWTNKK